MQNFSAMMTDSLDPSSSASDCDTCAAGESHARGARRAGRQLGLVPLPAREWAPRTATLDGQRARRRARLHARRTLDTAPPNRRAELEVALARIQDDPRLSALRLPYLRASARLDDAALEHIVALFDRVRELSDGSARDRRARRRRRSAGARAANAALRDEMRAATTTSKRSNASPPPPSTLSATRARVPSRNVSSLSSRRYFGFTIARAMACRRRLGRSPTRHRSSTCPSATRPAGRARPAR